MLLPRLSHNAILMTGLKITAGQRTMSGLDRGLDRSNSGIAGHFDQSFLDTNILFSLQLLLNVL